MGRMVENGEYVAMMRRMTRALRRRVGDSDPSDVAEMLALASELDEAIGLAVAEMRARHGFSWAQIAEPLGITRQAASQRWGRVAAPAGEGEAPAGAA